MAEERGPEKEGRPATKEAEQAVEPEAAIVEPVGDEPAMVEPAAEKPDGEPSAAAKADGEKAAAAKADGQKPADDAKQADGKQATAKAKAKAASKDVGQAETQTEAQDAALFAQSPELQGTTAGMVAHRIVKSTPSWLVSMVVHVVVLLVLAVITLPASVPERVRELVVAPDNIEELEDLDAPDEPLEDIDVTVPDMAVETTVEPERVDVTAADDIQAAAIAVELSDVGLDHAPKNDLLASVGAYSGDALSGRGKGRERLVRTNGGNDASEQAVAMALKWLAEHQFPDGSWNFNHAMAPRCHGQCKDPGELSEARNAATGMALLPFLGAGQTHKTGQYREQVKKGLYFLVNRMQVSPQGGSLFEEGGRMYAHGICSIVLCEAYAMTHDKGLYAPAQQAINFICYAQDPVGGGWRYAPRQRGDTSVVGWQIMALKSGHMAYLRIPPITIKKAFTYLDTVQANNGANYGYTDPGKGDATTAIGLLCRMYLGWKHDNPALERGVRFISDKGPSKTNVYYNYYATQVMRHWEGDQWTKWNNVMRDYLVSSQAKSGHEKGSWFLASGQGHADSKGGRLYHTAMCTMVLEVYYRHMPIYGKQSTEEDFPLD